MSKPKKDPGLSGMLSAEAKVRKVGRQVVVTSRPPRRTATENMLAVRERFKEAAQYAKAQLSQPELKALYTTGITEEKRSAHIVAMSDYLNPPKVESISILDYLGVIGDPIIVKAVDDFMVTRVKVIITDSSGAVIESGEAGPDKEKTNLWQYKATAANPALPGTTIKAYAIDRPGNIGVGEVLVGVSSKP